MQSICIADLLNIVVDKVGEVCALRLSVSHRFQPTSRILVGIMCVASIRIEFVRQTSLNIPDPRGNISVLVGDALQTATIAPVV